MESTRSTRLLYSPYTKNRWTQDLPWSLGLAPSDFERQIPKLDQFSWSHPSCYKGNGVMTACIAVVHSILPLHDCTGKKCGLVPDPCLDWDTIHASGFYAKKKRGTQYKNICFLIKYNLVNETHLLDVGYITTPYIL
jgi:hypothetical protein